jgi:3-hydroxymyristoyl/3-hydroxydecanoyl-(acyl carrier protein) dehydratase
MLPKDTSPPGFKSLEKVKLVEKTENSVTLEFAVPSASPYYDGHFPGFPILPALAQMEMSVRLASQYLGTDIDVSEIKRIKFSNLVKPDKLHFIRLEKGEKTLSFKVFSPDSDAAFSSGTIVMRQNSVQQKSV